MLKLFFHAFVVILLTYFKINFKESNGFDPDQDPHSGVAGTPKKLCISKGDYWIKQWLSSIMSLFETGITIKGKNFFPEGANSFL